MSLASSVGAAGRNYRTDVMLVQRLLTQHGNSPGPIDGLCGPRTVRAILAFQSLFISHPDGRVDPQGDTWRHLNNAKASAMPPKPAQSPAATAARAQALAPSTPNQDLIARVPKPARATINQSLTAVSPSFMVQQLGQPRSDYSANCQPITNATLKRHLVSQSVGPFNVTGLRPALESLRTALAQVKREQPAVYAALGTAGMLCCRYIRNSNTNISNHSWGTAVDLTLKGVLDKRGDNMVQVGLALMAPIMNQHGWYWGAAFGTEDAMHFEASRSLVSKWSALVR
jgi:peptidoglycan hydrolase-like protein with peptidoglycan-binding domain